MLKSKSNTYDATGRLISETTSSGGSVNYGYNALNLRTQLTNARGQARTYTYDAIGRVTGYTSVEGSASYTYDKNGNVLTATDQNGTVTREYDALNRVKKYTDTLGNVIRYEYDAVGNLKKLIYPDNTVVTYAYDANNNLVSVTDWANRVTTYSYDSNNNVIGVTKPDGSITTTIYDNAQRVISTVERNSSNTVIVGYEYTYDDLGRILSEIHLAKNIKYDYTYDSLSHVTKRIVTNLSDNTTSEEVYAYDAAGNITSCTVSNGANTFVYDQNNRLISYNGQAVTYDMDGNMLSATLNGAQMSFVYDSANRLISAGGNTYTYNVEDVRVRNLCGESETTYAYNTNGRLSQLLVKTTDGVITKYVYGLGLIGEETGGSFKTYHFDYRGSTAAITDINGNVTDTFEYDTYGNLVSRTGTSAVIFLYNGRDGVVTDENGLIYMRARYYSPELRRFINSDIIAGEISNAVTLNRYAYANGNPVSNIDPFGLSAERGQRISYFAFDWSKFDGYYAGSTTAELILDDINRVAIYNTLINSIKTAVRPNNIGKGTWNKIVAEDLRWVEKTFGKSSNLAKALKSVPYITVALDTGLGVYENIQNNSELQQTISDAIVDIGFGLGGIAASTAAGSAAGSIVPGAGTAVGAVVGFVAGTAYYVTTDVITIKGKTLVDWAKYGAGWLADKIAGK